MVNGFLNLWNTQFLILRFYAYVRAKSFQSCLIFCNPMNLEWVAMRPSRGPSRPRDETHISCVSCISKQVLDH